MPKFASAQLAFAKRLRDLRLHAGHPSEQWLANQVQVSRTTISDILNGRRFPQWDIVKRFVVACGEDPADWRQPWLDAATARDTQLHAPPRSEEALEQPMVAELPIGRAHLSAVWYRDNPEFYRAAAEQLRKTQSEIRVTYVRRSPPTHYTSSASADYFQAVLDWARASDCSDDTQRSVRRIIGIRENNGIPDPGLLGWAWQHHDETSDILNYEARVLRWQVAADGLNMALLDDRVAFLAFSDGSRQKLNGFSIEDPTFLHYFVGYFDQLWHNLVPLDDYLGDMGSR